MIRMLRRVYSVFGINMGINMVSLSKLFLIENVVWIATFFVIAFCNFSHFTFAGFVSSRS